MFETDGVGNAGGAADGVKLETLGDALVLRVTGALDLTLAPKVRQLVERARRLAPPVLVIDLTEVDFLASAGMAELVRAHRLAASTAVRVVATGRVTLRPLELTRLADELVIVPTLSAALDRV
ncbi:anti-sigma factor antagonist [Amycolatopsis balhimycina DSM 5908]|uniref:Anti-sigma factor antagonist n=1 Tax=Amycolatopsis balhimycina DSM 5908 TaxID=1081091 RepID=A0A428WSH0_AMYBA|nr:STAS domain-containing protein [Amycolatopsis balhimycina]RSM46017.1 anti-sigma factor antagonist [Amycolatopsis balhimycina DSM 5908]